jgi:ABC-type glycerol-3-phosphate transport system substrate-binding protein
MRGLRWTLALLLSLALLGAASCGGDEGADEATRPDPDAAKVRALAVRFLENDPVVCDHLTKRFVAGVPDFSVKKCRANAKAAEPREGIRVVGVEVAGDRARARVRTEGSGEGVITMVKQEGVWRIARLG